MDHEPSHLPVTVKTLVLWDIDGTLVDVKGAGRRSFIHALEKAWGIVDDIADVKFGGATDLGVLAQLRARLHLPDEHTPHLNHT